MMESSYSEAENIIGQQKEISLLRTETNGSLTILGNTSSNNSQLIIDAQAPHILTAKDSRTGKLGEQIPRQFFAPSSFILKRMNF